MIPIRLIGPLLGCLAAAVPALGADEAMEMLMRSAVAARHLDYSGVFLYETAGRMETSRITHIWSDGHEHEKLERLDGPPRELIRHDDEITCVNPADRTLHVERGRGRRFFPALVPNGAAGLGEMYEAKFERVERIAGIDCRVVRLKPRDAFRYGRKMCIEPTHGLILHATLRNDGDEILEQFAFTQLSVGTRLDPSLVKPSGSVDGWTVEPAPADPKPGGGWVVGNLPPGFRKVFQFQRGDSEHMVYSDGLAAISVFIEPLRGNITPGGARVIGASSIAQRNVLDRRVTVVGEVPVAAVTRLADSVSRAP